MSSEALDEGYDAYWDGADVSSNPHKEDTDEHRSWEEGWRAARRHDYKESVLSEEQSRAICRANAARLLAPKHQTS